MGVRDYPCFSSFCGFEGREGDGRSWMGKTVRIETYDMVIIELGNAMDIHIRKCV
jgi:hypothetical protein